MKKLLITQRYDYYEKIDELRESLDQRLTSLITNAGFLPLPISNELLEYNFLDYYLRIQSPDGIILSGGNNLGTYPRRDDTELFLLNYAKTNNLPVLGICRGMQLMATWAGCNLKPIKSHVRTRHNLRGEYQTDVNSFHSYSLSKCPTNFKVTATSEDGAIEAIKHESLPWEGWMWHPERERKTGNVWIKHIQSIFKQ